MNKVETQFLAILAKSVAYLCISSSDLRNASIGDKAKFLRSLGFADRDVASLLNTSENSIRVLISLHKKSRKNKSKSKIDLKEGK
jgi:hypothetical protein